MKKTQQLKTKFEFDKPVDILVMPDAHAKPNQDLRRFDWFGKLLVDRQPDVVVDLGDFADMESLSSYDIGKKSYEGRRLKHDVAAAREARVRVVQPLRDVQERQRNNRKSLYRPYLFALGGNHDEGRYRKALEGDCKLDGTISWSDLGYEDSGFSYIPFLEILTVNGWCFSHYVVSGVMGRPVGGANPARSLLKQQHTSTVVGHSHLLDVATETLPDGRRIWGIQAGCFLDEDQWESYAGPANKLWWKGCILLKGCYNGDCEGIELITMKELRNTYGE